MPTGRDSCVRYQGTYPSKQLHMLLYQLVAVLAFQVTSAQTSSDHGPSCAPDLQVQLMDERSLRKMLNTFEKKVCVWPPAV